MEREFGYPGTARVLIRDVSVYEAKIYKNRIEQIDGVEYRFPGRIPRGNLCLERLSGSAGS